MQIKDNTLDPEAIKSAQGSAGVKAIYDVIKSQIHFRQV